MSIVAFCGGELDVPNVFFSTMEGNVGGSGGNLTRNTSQQRQGKGCYEFAGTNIAVNNGWFITPWSPFSSTGITLDTDGWFQFYIKIITNPTQDVIIASFSTSITSNILLRSDGKIYFDQDGSQTSNSINDSAWHRITIRLHPSSTQANRSWTMKVDGVTVSSGSGQNTETAFLSSCRISAIPFAATTSFDILFDDISFNNSAGTDNNVEPGDQRVICLVPNTDNSRGSWTAGAGGTTNLWDALNNAPPAGLAAASETNTSQVKASAVATTGKWDTETYISAGAGANDTVLAAMIQCLHGEEVATGTKSGHADTDTALNNTPTHGTGSFSFGGDIGACGTYPTNWASNVSATAFLGPFTPTSLSTGVRLGITTTTTSRVADSCSLAFYVLMKVVSNSDPVEALMDRRLTSRRRVIQRRI